MIFAFEDFELDEDRFELRKGGARVELQPKPLRLLVYLVRNRNRVVPQRELFDRVWSDVIVSETALSSALREVRRALGDDSRTSRVIETLRGHGYRFVASVEESGETARVVPRGPEPSGLSAILVANLLGRTALLHPVGDEPAKPIFQQHHGCLEQLVASYNGDELGWTGDRLTAVFSSPADAVGCAIAIQREMLRPAVIRLAARGESRSAFQRAVRGEPLALAGRPDPGGEAEPQVRIGIHLAETVVREDEVFGNGVNIAARVQGLAEAGQILVSGEVAYAVQGQGTVDTSPRGEHEFKNVDRPVTVYSIGETVDETVHETATEPAATSFRNAQPKGAPARRLALAALGVCTIAVLVGLAWWMNRPTPPTDAPMSIAVLPFDDLSPAGDQEFFAHGMSEELTSVLSRAKNLRVIGSLSAAVAKQRGLSIVEIGEQLQVASVLGGSVRKSGDRLRIAVHLSSASDGFQIWAESYERPLGDVFELQDEIAAAVARAVGAEPAKPRKRPTVNPVAYEKFLVARRLYGQETRDSFRRAIEYLGEAVKLDPKFTSAYVLLSELKLNTFNRAFERDPKILDDAMALADQALAIDDQHAGAHFHKARLLAREYQWEAAEREFQRASELDPKRATSTLMHGAKLVELGRIDEGIEEMEASIRRDPLATADIYSLGAAYLWVVGDPHRAAELGQRAVELSPGSVQARELLALAYYDMDQDQAAFDTMAKTFPPQTLDRAHAVFAGGGFPATLRDMHVYMTALTGDECFLSEWDAAVLSAVYGANESALTCLERSFERRGTAFLNLRVSSLWEPLRGDPRFKALIRRMNYPATP